MNQNRVLLKRKAENTYPGKSVRISSYEATSSQLTQIIIDVIAGCQDTAEQEGVEIVAYALEHGRFNLLLMVRYQTEREKLLNDFISYIAECFGACDIAAWKKDWETFSDNGGLRDE